ncbi:Hypothetical predicted protein [Paramuricea clavata]|uniref:Uncharacterized protein n=1 Tax=Paramuricea clavata TaxID=317549 RepID=A0A7D9M062_PARCT|nr:Hypothetical predicted protein [Paramuricea clavata]
MADSWFHFTKAVVRRVSSRFAEGSLKLEEPEEAISLTKAKEQWTNYVAALKGLGLEIIEIEADDKSPDCVFIEDAAVVCDDTALITRPGHASRRGETVAVRKTLEKLGLKIIDMTDPALLDGGDVLFTGQELFVGLTSRTNKEGVESLAKAFPKYPVTAIDMAEEGNVFLPSKTTFPNLNPLTSIDCTLRRLSVSSIVPTIQLAVRKGQFMHFSC